jgi:hypothetical protein
MTIHLLANFLIVFLFREKINVALDALQHEGLIVRDFKNFVGVKHHREAFAPDAELIRAVSARRV